MDNRRKEGENVADFARQRLKRLTGSALLDQSLTNLAKYSEQSNFQPTGSSEEGNGSFVLNNEIFAMVDHIFSSSLYPAISNFEFYLMNTEKGFDRASALTLAKRAIDKILELSIAKQYDRSTVINRLSDLLEGERKNRSDDPEQETAEFIDEVIVYLGTKTDA
jgi:hypothetical protein